MTPSVPPGDATTSTGSPSQARWPINAVAVGHAVAGVWNMWTAITAIRFFFLLGGFAAWDNWTGEWEGIGGFLHVLSAAASLFGPIFASGHLLAAWWLYRRQRVGRWLALGLGSLSLAFLMWSVVSVPQIIVLRWPGAVLAIATFVVLLPRSLAAQFARKDTRPVEVAAED